ncbi:hypothetical protein CYMTET_16871 [Cymbomonas tetramitiformis]|uniref:Uncharacterized protein n=1 Tax=Cymbomonas tetramitiformis TaxID=36881 RepID=A0AAE0GBH4_9CHLO|nr:hypothetical protein CYMTET_16871 [Cymbomonas tetramitiformis]
MSKKQDKAKVAERTPPETPMDSTYGDLSEGLSEDGISVGEDSAALTALIDERQQQLFSQQDARLNELMKMVQVLAQAVPQLAANQNAGTGNAIASPEAAESGMSGSSVKSRVASGTVGVPLPLLTDMLKGFKSLTDSDEEDGENSWQPFEGVGGIPSDDWASGLFCHHCGDDSDCSIPALDSASNFDSGDDGYASGAMPDLVDASDSDEEDDAHSWQPLEGVGGIPSDDWASGLFCPPRKNRLCATGAEPGIEDCCSSDWYYDAPDLAGGSDSDDEDACELRGGHPMCNSLVLCVASADSKADVFTRALPLAACGGQVAMLDSGASKHIFNSVADFGDDFDATSSSTFSVVQAGTVSSEGSGTVTFAKLDVSTGRAVGLNFTGAHCIPGRPFNLVSVVALEDAGFSVDFGARQISNGGVTFSFSRVGNQYIIYEDQISGTLDTYMACAAYHDDSDRDKTDWKFEMAGKHIEEHGPFTLELFASSDNHILDNYCTTDSPCFCRDWAGEACYGNPPYEHDTILRCLQKALGDFDRAPHSTKFLLVLTRWETASWW